MSDFDEFKSYYALADELMELTTPEQLAECLRMVIKLAHRSIARR